MTNRERIQAKPPEVQVVLKAKMTKLSLNDEQPDWEHYAGEALGFWDNVCQDMGVDMEDEDDEAAMAVQIVAALLGQEVWGKILREGTNA